MSTTFRPYAPEQSLRLLPDVREWPPEGRLAHHVSDLVDRLDLTAFCAPYEGGGRRNAPNDPRIMVNVLLYGYATGGVLVASDCAEAGRGRVVPNAGGGQLSANIGRLVRLPEPLSLRPPYAGLDIPFSHATCN